MPRVVLVDPGIEEPVGGLIVIQDDPADAAHRTRGAEVFLPGFRATERFRQFGRDILLAGERFAAFDEKSSGNSYLIPWPRHNYSVTFWDFLRMTIWRLIVACWIN